MKVWAKIVIDHKVKNSTVVEFDDDFFQGVIKVCEALKIPTPIVTESQKQNFQEFNILKLKQRDFIETIPFDFLEFNAIIEK